MPLNHVTHDLPEEMMLPNFPDMRRGLPALAILLTCGWVMSMNEADPDLYGHLQYGREVLAQGALPATSTWTYTVPGYRWINHENLAEIGMAWAMDTFGVWGLTFGKYLLGTIMLCLVIWNARRQGTGNPSLPVSYSVVGFVCVVMALTVEFHWHFRPQVFGYVLFAAMCVLLSWSFSQWEPILRSERNFSGRFRGLWGLIPLFCIWANTHGSFAAGVAIAAAYLSLRLGELVWYRGWRGTRLLPYFAGFLAVGAIVTLCNPYGPQLHLWLWQALHQPRPEISDWGATHLFDGSRESSCWWLIVLTTCCASWRKRDWTHSVIFALTAWQAATHIRHLPLLAIVWGSWMAVDLEILWRAIKGEHQPNDDAFPAKNDVRTPGLLTSSLLGAWCLMMGVLTWPRVAELKVDPQRFPVAALDYMKQHEIEGRTIVTFNWAQYAIGEFAASGLDSTVAIDGRFRTCYPQRVIDIYFDFFLGEHYPGVRYRSPASPPVDPHRALTFRNPELVLISKLQKPTVETMRRHEDEWKLIYEDEIAELWGRRQG